MTNIKDALESIAAVSACVSVVDNPTSHVKMLANINTLATQALSQLTASPDREKVARDTWDAVEQYLTAECSFECCAVSEADRKNCANIIANATDRQPARSQLVAAAVEFLRAADGITGINRIRVDGKMMSAADVADAILSAIAPDEAAKDEDEAYEIGKRDGYEEAFQELDLATGGDGEFKGSTIPGETVDVPEMKARIASRLRDKTQLKECRICGFTIDTFFAAVKPTADFTMRGRTKSGPDEAVIRADEQGKVLDKVCENLLVLSRGDESAIGHARVALHNAAVFICGADRVKSAAAIRGGRS